jgi:hypothetical protein
MATPYSLFANCEYDDVGELWQAFSGPPRCGHGCLITEQRGLAVDLISHLIALLAAQQRDANGGLSVFGASVPRCQVPRVDQASRPPVKQAPEKSLRKPLI